MEFGYLIAIAAAITLAIWLFCVAVDRVERWLKRTDYCLLCHAVLERTLWERLTKVAHCADADVSACFARWRVGDPDDLPGTFGCPAHSASGWCDTPGHMEAFDRF